MSKQLVTKLIFWLAFCAFLSVSIPHVAWMYHSYEPQDLPVWWVIAYAVAIGIDILVCWLSWVQSNGNTGDKIVTWLFIGLLAALSWYANYLYSMVHNPAYQVRVWNIDLGFGITTGQVTPVIVSAIPVFIIGYTYMLSKVNKADVKPKTALQLKAEADELQDAMREKQRIAALKRGGKVSALTGLFDAGKTVVNHVRKADESTEHNAAITEQDTTISETSAAPIFTSENAAPAQVPTQPISAGIMPMITEQDAPVKPDDNAGIHAGITEQDTTKNDTASGSTGARSVSIKEASRIMGKSEQYVRTLVNNGKLHTAPRNKKLVLKSSIDALLTARKETGKMAAITPLKVVSDEEDSTEQDAGITLGIVEQMMYDALAQNTEELPALLRLANEQGIEELTATLKARYSEHAGYITEQRVTNVLAYVRQGADEQLSA